MTEGKSSSVTSGGGMQHIGAAPEAPGSGEEGTLHCREL